MTKKIFKGILFTALVTMLACLVFIIGVQYQFYSEAQTDALKSEAYLIERSLENGTAPESFNSFEKRITIISADGTVIYDNKSDINGMKNHSDRKEVAEALKKGIGSDVRYSESVGKYTSYYAVFLKNGNILRVAGDGTNLITVLLRLMPPICAIILLTAALALTLASVVTKNILKPINEIDPENPEQAKAYDELSPLLNKLRYQKNKINKQISQLTQSRLELEILSENMSEGMLLTDKNGIILTYNKSIERLFGEQTKLSGKNLLYLNRSKVFLEIFDSIIGACHNELLFSDGNRWLELITNPVNDENGAHKGAVVLIIDVTERQERERLRREFTANVSHELKTPLTSILGFSDILKEGLVSPEDVKGFSADINRETKRLITLVNDIINLSRLDEGVIGTDREPVELLSVAREVTERLTIVASEQHISLNTCGQEAVILANPSLIFEMIYNLCDNAVKYNRENGSVTVTVGLCEENPFISVKDTGIGIPKEAQPRIFERFYRVDKSRSNTRGGTGLGLSIVKHIASVTGGTISLESSPDVGTEITVTFGIC